MDQYVPDMSGDNPLQSVSDEAAMRQRERLAAYAAELEAEHGPVPEAELARVQAIIDSW